MENLFSTLQSSAAQGLIWAIMTIGIFITYRLLDFADLTVEGTFTLGAAVTVVFINKGMNPFLAVLISFIAGSLAGLLTGIFNTVFKIPPILSGILTMIALYSINIRVMSDKGTVPIAGEKIKDIVTSVFGDRFTSNEISIFFGVVFNLVIIIALYMFFGTEIGSALRATGSNSNMARALGVNTSLMTVLGLMVSNALVAVAGSLIAQFDYGSAIVTMGQGTIVIGLASVIIGEVIFCHRDHNFAYRLTAVVLGAIIYRTIISFVLKTKFLKSTDLKLITAIIVSIALALPVIKEKIAGYKNKINNSKKYSELGGHE